MSQGDTESPKIAKGNAIVDQAAKAAVMQMLKPQIIVLASPKLNLDQFIQENNNKLPYQKRKKWLEAGCQYHKELDLWYGPDNKLIIEDKKLLLP